MDDTIKLVNLPVKARTNKLMFMLKYRYALTYLNAGSKKSTYIYNSRLLVKSEKSQVHAHFINSDIHLFHNSRCVALIEGSVINLLPGNYFDYFLTKAEVQFNLEVISEVPEYD